MKELVSLPNVLRETLEKLDYYIHLLLSWNQKINLVSKGQSYEHIISDHVLDSILLKEGIPEVGSKVIDVGSGAGFPGLVLAILGYTHCYLVEKNTKKVAFLIEAAAQLEIRVDIRGEDIREVTGIKADYIVSRALCSISQLIAWSAHLIDSDTRYLLHKGASWQQEIQILEKNWGFQLQEYENPYKQQGKLILISNLKKINN